MLNKLIEQERQILLVFSKSTVRVTGVEPWVVNEKSDCTHTVMRYHCNWNKYSFFVYESKAIQQAIQTFFTRVSFSNLFSILTLIRIRTWKWSRRLSTSVFLETKFHFSTLSFFIYLLLRTELAYAASFFSISCELMLNLRILVLRALITSCSSNYYRGTFLKTCHSNKHYTHFLYIPFR